MVKAFAKRRDLIFEGLNAIDGIKCLKPMGAFYILADISSFGMPSGKFCESLLEQALVAAVPGVAFGNDGVMRLSYACSTENIEKGLSRIRDFCARLRK